MATISQQLTELVNQKNALATNLNTMGVMASTDETLNTLVPKVLDIETGGGGSSGGQYLVQVIDYDGTVLKSDHLDTGATFTLPDAPTNHPKLVFQSWSLPVTITNNTITVGNSDITIGATYKTASGLTEIDITLTKVTGLDVTCNMVGNKNWGDGTTDSATTHTYTSYGNYTITCDGTSIPAGTNSSSGMFGSSSSSRNYYCTKIRVGELVSSIGDYAFNYSYSLTSITVPNSVTTIGNYTFQYCNSLIAFVSPINLTSIGSYTFGLCSSLTSITMPKNITNIGERIFNGCSSLASITIPDSVTSISDYAFTGCSSLTSITLPNNLTSIGANAFNNCDSLFSINIPNNVTSIGASAFANCNSISSITIPDGVTYIENYLFNSCRCLKSISLPNSVISINPSAFINCGRLDSITIPANVTSVGSMAFVYCYSIIKYDFTNLTSVPTLDSQAFIGINGICKIYVPDALYDSWIAATNWVTYEDYIYKASEMED